MRNKLLAIRQQLQPQIDTDSNRQQPLSELQQHKKIILAPPARKCCQAVIIIINCTIATRLSQLLDIDNQLEKPARHLQLHQNIS